MPYLALQGVRVVELATEIAGPYCGKMLADYGAEVIKIEQPGVGDPARGVGPFPDGQTDAEKSALFLHLNTNKSSVAVDLGQPTGRELVTRLAETADVLVESHPPGALDNLGLGYESLSGVNAGLVVTSITPFGQTGPNKDHEFTELTAFATGGAMHREGIPEREPLRYGGETAQYFAGTVAVAATMAAVFHASLTGEGEWIDISIQEAMAGHPHQAGRRGPFAYSGETDPRKAPHAQVMGRASYAVGTWPCKDGYISMLPLGPRMWPSIVNMIDRPEMLSDPRFRTPEDRGAHQDEFDAIFLSWLKNHTRWEIFAAAQEARLPCSPVLSIDEAMEDAQFADREHFIEIEHPAAGRLRYPGYPFRLSALGTERQRPAPRLGEHTEQVLRSTPADPGLDAGDIDRLRSEGVV